VLIVAFVVYYSLWGVTKEDVFERATRLERDRVIGATEIIGDGIN
jgi:hypothetical protein